MHKHFSFAGLAVYEAPEEALRRYAGFMLRKSWKKVEHGDR